MKIGSRLSAALATVGLATAMTVGSVIMAPAAQADATDVAHWGEICYAGKCIPQGAMIHDTYGEGLAIRSSSVTISAYTPRPICNYWIDYDFYDLQGNNYYHSQGRAVEDCVWNIFEREFHPVVLNYQSGQACATLYSNSRKIVTSCNYVTAN